MSFVDPGAATDASTAGGKSGFGGGDPFAAFSGLGGGLGDVLGGGLGLGGVGDTAASPGGDISQVASAQGDPTGAVQAQQSVQAGAPTPGVPGGGIGGAQSGQSGATQQTQPFNPAVGFQQPPTEGGYKPASTTGQPMDPTQQPDSTIPKTTGPGSGEQYGPPMQPPADFSQRFQDPTFAQRFGQQNMAPGGNMAPTLPQLSQSQLAQSGIANPPPGVTNIPTNTPGTPNVDTPTAGPATPTTTGAGTPAAAPAATADTTGKESDTTGKKPEKTADTADASSTGGQGGGGQGGAGGRGGIPGLGNINPLALISALLRGGPRGALSELAREAMGQGMMNPNMPGGGAPGRGYSPGGTGRTGTDEGPETPETPQTPEQAEQAAQAQAQQQAAAAGQPAPGVAPTSTGFAEGQPPGTPGTSAGLPSPPAWATAAGQPNTNATQNASLGGGNLPSTGAGGGGAPSTNAVPPGGYNTPVQGTNYHGGMATAQAHANNFGQPLDPNLYRDRERYRQELLQKPWLREKALRIMYNEQGRNAQGTQSIMETAMNRASVRRTSLEQSLRWHRAEPGGYYQIGNKGMGMGPYREVLQRSFNNALNGSNLSNYATDNSSGGLAQREARTGAFNRRQGYTGETFFAPGRAEPGFARNWEQWHGNMRGQATAAPGRMPVNIQVRLPQRAGEGSPIESFAPGSMGRGNIAENWRRSSNVEDVRNPTFGQRFEGDTPAAEARIRKANYEASLPGYTAPPSQLANALGLGDIRLDQITQLLSQLQASPPQ